MSEKTRRTRVKICGITRTKDAMAAVDAGVDALGFVFYRKSARYVTPDHAARIIATLPPFVSRVALFVNAPHEAIGGVIEHVPVDLLQFHGDETPDACRRFGLPYVKAIRMHPTVDLARACDEYAEASALLLDSFVEGAWGGTGKSFDWSKTPAGVGKRFIVAGGLTADNVADAIMRCSPYAVDVSGGVERAPGIKDAEKINRLMREVSCAENPIAG